jgi:uncharacterized protein
MRHLKIAVIGSGISGLACAYRLAQNGAVVTLFEANDYFGGHAHTVDVTLDGMRCGVDTGFLVFNDRCYPQLIELFEELGIDSVATDMSFSVKAPLKSGNLEWAGTDLNSVFVQRRNLIRPSFLGMLRDILRFNLEASALVRGANLDADTESLGDFLDLNAYGAPFRNWYLLPMAGCIWSCPTRQMLDFPLSTFVRFCANHGLLQLGGRPQWRTIPGGARRYVDKLVAGISRTRLNEPVRAVARSSAGVRVRLDGGTELFDHAVLAVHSDQALKLLSDASSSELDLLGLIRFQPNRAVLHTDAACLPQNRTAWAAWNYESGVDAGKVCVHYLINRLQPLPFTTPLIVSLNPVAKPHPATVLAEYDYAHPVFDAGAVAAQRRLTAIQGQRNTWFAGAWTGYGFHEDGLKSGLAVARGIERVAASRQPALHVA